MRGMDRIDPQRLATIIETAPILTRLGLAAPDQRCRERIGGNLDGETRLRDKQKAASRGPAA